VKTDSEAVRIPWGHFPFVRPTLAFMVGIAAYEAAGNGHPLAVTWATAALVASAVSWGLMQAFLPPLGRRTRVSISTVVLLTFAAFGFLWTGLRDETRHPAHILHMASDLRAWQGVVEEGLTRKATYTATTVRVERVRRADGRWQNATGRVKLLVRAAPNGQPPPLTYGTEIVVTGTFKRVPGPPNPAQFDYAAYLRHRHTWHEQFVNAEGYAVTGHRTLNPLTGWSLRASDVLAAALHRYVPGARENGLLTALVLGVTDDLATDLKTAYGATGTTHVLAVSGLHIALVFGLIIGLLGGSEWHRRRPAARWLTLVAVLAVCWGYALITGLSASVLRSVVMATLVAVGRALGRRISLFNTLAVAALLLLWLDPQYLFDVGFQLSFLAVLSIALLQPRLARRWQPEAWLPRQLWSGITVALAAQTGTFPLTLYYFHQLPIQFLAANLVAVPWSNGLLISSFVLLILAGLRAGLVAVGIPAAWAETGVHKIGYGLGQATAGLNAVMAAIGRLPGAVITGISITALQLVLLFLVLMAFLLWLHARRRVWLVTAMALVALYAGTRAEQLVRTAHERVFVVYAVRRHAALGLHDGLMSNLLADSAVWADSIATTNGLRANVLPHIWARGAKRVTWAPALATGDTIGALPPTLIGRWLPDGNRLLAWRGLRLLVLDRPMQLQPAADAPLLAVDYVLIHGRPRVVPSALARAVACRWIILDGSSSAAWARRRAQELRAAGFRCHDVGEAGAFIRRWP
jgi:competence protein ComEC